MQDVLIQLKQKNIKTKCIYPAQLKVLMEFGNPTLADVLPTLQELSIQAQVNNQEQMERELAYCRWSSVGGRRRKDTAALLSTDAKAFFNGAE